MIIILLMVTARLITGIKLDDWNENILKDGASLAIIEVLLEISYIWVCLER